MPCLTARDGPIWGLSRFLVLLGLAALAGCGPGASYGTSTKSASWSGNKASWSGNKGVPGIDEGSIASFQVWSGPADPVQFTVWSDLPNETGRSSSGPRGVAVESRQYAPDARSVESRYEAADGKPGTVEVAGRRFDPAKGPLFLVRTDREPFRIEQVAFDLARLPLENAGDEAGTKEFEDRPAAIRALAGSEPRIGDFFGARVADADLARAATGGRPARRESIDGETIELIEGRLDAGGANDPFLP